MALRASFAAILLLGSAVSAVSAAEAPAPMAAAPAEDPTLPRFAPSPEAYASPVVQAVPAAAESTQAEAEAEAAAQAEDERRALGDGVASWYGSEFAGRRTASGERFNPGGYTAAHRTLPFGSRVRVTRGGKSVVVRINDRGPFSRGRVIDLSQAAAAELGLVRAGSGRVQLALLD